MVHDPMQQPNLVIPMTTVGMAFAEETKRKVNQESNNHMTTKQTGKQDGAGKQDGSGKQDGADGKRSPLTATPGAAAKGKTAGGAAVGAAIGAVAGAVAGPLGAAVGMVAGAIGGALAGKEVAERVERLDAKGESSTSGKPRVGASKASDSRADDSQDDSQADDSQLDASSADDSSADDSSADCSADGCRADGSKAEDSTVEETSGQSTYRSENSWNAAPRTPSSDYRSGAPGVKGATGVPDGEADINLDGDFDETEDSVWWVV